MVSMEMYKGFFCGAGQRKIPHGLAGDPDLSCQT